MALNIGPDLVFAAYAARRRSDDQDHADQRRRGGDARICCAETSEMRVQGIDRRRCSTAKVTEMTKPEFENIAR
jgi:hypothetical protein